MKKSKLVILYTSIKLMIVIGLCMVIGVHHVCTQLWLSPIAADGAIQRELERSERPNVDAYSPVSGKTGLMLAAQGGYLERTKMLVQYRANVNLVSKDAEKNTALHVAAARADMPDGIKIVEILIQNYADVYAQDVKGNTPLHLITLVTYDDRAVQVAKLLTDQARKVKTEEQPSLVNVQNNDGSTLIHRIVDKNDQPLLEQIHKMLGDEIDMSIKNKDGLTPYALAKRVHLEDPILDYLKSMEKKKS